MIALVEAERRLSRSRKLLREVAFPHAVEKGLASNDHTYLTEAIYFDSLEDAATLIDAGCSLHDRVASVGNVEMVKLLTSLGRPNVLNDRPFVKPYASYRALGGGTCLHLIAAELSKKNVECDRTLLCFLVRKLHVDTSLKDSSGRTFLALAVHLKRWTFAKSLFEAGVIENELLFSLHIG